jgi:hypothetical protein
MCVSEIVSSPYIFPSQGIHIHGLRTKYSHFTESAAPTKDVSEMKNLSFH